MVGAEEEAEESEEEGGKDVVARQEANHRACDLDLLACIVFAGGMGHAFAASRPRDCSSQSPVFGEFVFGFRSGNFIQSSDLLITLVIKTNKFNEGTNCVLRLHFSDKMLGLCFK